MLIIAIYLYVSLFKYFVHTHEESKFTHTNGNISIQMSSAMNGVSSNIIYTPTPFADINKFNIIKANTITTDISSRGSNKQSNTISSNVITTSTNLGRTKSKTTSVSTNVSTTSAPFGRNSNKSTSASTNIITTFTPFERSNNRSISVSTTVVTLPTQFEEINDNTLVTVSTEMITQSTPSGDVSSKLINTTTPFGARNNKSNKVLTNVTTTSKPSWLSDALKNIAYYLRSHKFNEYDRRYQTNSHNAPRKYYTEFPRPPLRSLHWEVHKFCEEDFISCIEYIRQRVNRAGFKRADDATYVIEEQKWNRKNHTKQIQVIEAECRKLQQADDLRADPFQGPIERFQWRTTASYYMCWYTMSKTPELKVLHESCDNFANCLDPKFGVHNNDARAMDETPFGCALYSFCPDPCCAIEHFTAADMCWNNEKNPCFEQNPVGKRECTTQQARNRDFGDIVLNRWNVSCHCQRKGYEWDSRYGICVDIDECIRGTHRCDLKQEACVNLPGSFTCACRWGYVWNDMMGACTFSSALQIIKIHKKFLEETDDNSAKSIVGRIYAYFYENSANRTLSYVVYIISIALTIFCIVL